MPGIDETKEVRASSVDQARDSARVDLDLRDLDSFVGKAFYHERVPELLELIFEGMGDLESFSHRNRTNPGVQAAIEAYRDWKQSQGGDMHTDVQPTERGRPQTIPREYAGKWIAWSEDGLRIVAVGESFDDCERAAVEAGVPANLAGVHRVPHGRSLRDEF